MKEKVVQPVTLNADPAAGSALPSVILDRAADLIEREGWTSDHHWLPSYDTSGRSWFSGTATTTNVVAPHPNYNADGFCILDAMVKVHPQGKFTFNLHRSWASMKEPHCGKLGKLLLDVIPELTGWPEGLVQWNDAPGRKQAEVIGRLREAAALSRCREAEDATGNAEPAAAGNPENRLNHDDLSLTPKEAGDD